MRGWSYTAGIKGARVTVYERRGRGGILYWRTHDPVMGAKGAYRKGSLEVRLAVGGERWAMQEAHRLAEELAAGLARHARGETTIAELLDLYDREVIAQYADKGRQQEDRRRIELWTRVLGAEKVAADLLLAEWEGIKRDRATGRRDACGYIVDEPEKRRPVKPRTVQADCLFLSMVFNWATRYRPDERSRFLIQENPLKRGFAMPAVDRGAQSRPVVGIERHRALRVVAEAVTMEIRWDGKRRRVRSYLAELLDILESHPKRISAVRQLLRSDAILRPVRMGSGDPLADDYGDLLYRPETDKRKRPAALPMNATIRAAVERQIERFADLPDDAPLFPSATDPTRPVAYRALLDWYRKAEELAGLGHVKGGGFHAHRRGWQTERKDLPLTDRMVIGGWEDERSARAYERPDERTVKAIIYGTRSVADDKSEA